MVDRLPCCTAGKTSTDNLGPRCRGRRIFVALVQAMLKKDALQRGRRDVVRRPAGRISTGSSRERQGPTRRSLGYTFRRRLRHGLRHTLRHRLHSKLRQRCWHKLRRGLWHRLRRTLRLRSAHVLRLRLAGGDQGGSCLDDQTLHDGLYLGNEGVGRQTGGER